MNLHFGAWQQHQILYFFWDSTRRNYVPFEVFILPCPSLLGTWQDTAALALAFPVGTEGLN